MELLGRLAGPALIVFALVVAPTAAVAGWVHYAQTGDRSRDATRAEVMRTVGLLVGGTALVLWGVGLYPSHVRSNQDGLRAGLFGLLLMISGGAGLLWTYYKRRAGAAGDW
jgi:hypothetical protein